MPLGDLDLSEASWLTDAGLRKLRKLPLTSLNLSRTTNRRLSNSGLRRLRGLSLTRLALCECEWLRNAGVAELKGLPLASLDLEGSVGMTYGVFAHLQELPLTRQNLDGCFGPNERALRDQPPAMYMGCVIS